ncbi:hypothetical protein Y032_0004g2200 [Ancylostoma ceylanicum]|uniref:Uncharacterized protein n=1 Tax=Ancylostoma ceylanicum TaxID=53326 RepID=A0A016VVX7_9BILA|nr:hypothetical protein Y032_0004g2200 [Ancylostoma ceylanicum]
MHVSRYIPGTTTVRIYKTWRDGNYSNVVSGTFLSSNKEIPEGHRHYFAIYHVKCSEGKTVKEIWTKTVKPDGVKRIAAVFEKPPPSDKK